MEQMSLLNGVWLILMLIGIASAVSLISKKLNFPYTIGLVIVGLIIGFVAGKIPFLGEAQLSEGIIFYLILPVLIFEAALNIDSKTLFKNAVPIFSLAVFAVLISAFITGGLLGIVIPQLDTFAAPTFRECFGAMLLFGALIATTDPVAVIVLFKEAGAPKRLTTIVDGESMSNDATAIVLFGIVLLHTNPAVQTAEGINFMMAVWDFFKELIGGATVGAIIGILGAYICKLDKDGREYQIVLSIIMAYLSSITALKLGFSGIAAPLAAGIVLSLKAEEVIKRKNREQVETFWEFFAFLANSFVFLLMGITQAIIISKNPINLHTVIALVAAIVVLLISRYISVISCNIPYNFFVRLRKKAELIISHKYSLILTWGGLRGAVPTALVLAIPQDYPLRDLVVQMTLACVLFSLLVQGTTIKKLMKKLGVKPEEDEIDESVCVKKEYSFPSKGLTNLIIPNIVKHCEGEGFFIREKVSEEQQSYLMKMRKHTFLFKAANENVQIVAEPQDIGYASTVMYETIIELNQSLGSMADVMKPDKISQIISSDDSESSGETKFNFMKYLAADSVIVPLKNTGKQEVIRELVEILKKTEKISDSQEVFDVVLEREKSMSTGLGDGVAFPHARTDTVENITAAIGVTHAGIDFEAIDKKPVYIVVLILSPQKDSTPHLQFLSEMSKVLSKANVREKIINTQTPEELYRILEERDW
ncbi:MAG: fructose PTS transporter subunit IIA [Chitinivibrionia bacterium]|nr:fructose PTS transporter subunit IIA [Chitinivibrionia bacterium]